MKAEEVIELIKQDPWMMQVLRAAETLQLPQWMIGAGFVRNKVWNYLSGKNNAHSTDIDLIYFDTSNLREEREKDCDFKLGQIVIADWSTKNQARMHLRNNTKPYLSSIDALAHWPETATAVAVSLKEEEVELFAPYGIGDLVSMTVRPSPLFPDGIERVRERVNQKKWLEQWPSINLAL